MSFNRSKYFCFFFFVVVYGNFISVVNTSYCAVVRIKSCFIVGDFFLISDWVDGGEVYGGGVFFVIEGRVI